MMKPTLLRRILLTAVTVVYAEQVEVTSEEMKAYNLKKEVHFIGDANVTQGKSWIYADRIVVYLDENNTAKKYVAEGNVRFKAEKNGGLYSGKADTISYDPVRFIYVLQGHASVRDLVNARMLEGAKVVLDMRTSRAEVKGSKEKGKRPVPVKFIFETDEKPKKKDH
jgi:lipopolysaccharide export system protein LptA